MAWRAAAWHGLARQGEPGQKRLRDMPESFLLLDPRCAAVGLERVVGLLDRYHRPALAEVVVDDFVVLVQARPVARVTLGLRFVGAGLDVLADDICPCGYVAVRRLVGWLLKSLLGDGFRWSRLGYSLGRRRCRGLPVAAGTAVSAPPPPWAGNGQRRPQRHAQWQQQGPT